MSTLPPPPTFSSPMVEQTPTRRRQADPSNVELLASFADSSGDSGGSGEDSKKRRHMHLEFGPLVISGAAIDRLRARFVSL